MIRVLSPQRPKDMDGYSVVPKKTNVYGKVSLQRIQWDNDYTWEELLEIREEIERRM